MSPTHIGQVDPKRRHSSARGSRFAVAVKKRVGSQGMECCRKLKRSASAGKVRPAGVRLEAGVGAAHGPLFLEKQNEHEQKSAS